MQSVSQFTYDDITENMNFEHQYEISTAVLEKFIELFGDCSPLHVDEQYAKAAGFAGRVVHGAIFNGFLSHFIGVKFPGQRALILSVDLRYLKPTYAGDLVTLKASVEQKVDSVRSLNLRVQFFNERQKQVVANGRVSVKVRDD